MAIVRLEGLGKLKKSSDLIGNRNRDLPACSMCLNQVGYRVPGQLGIININLWGKWDSLGIFPSHLRNEEYLVVGPGFAKEASPQNSITLFAHSAARSCGFVRLHSGVCGIRSTCNDSQLRYALVKDKEIGRVCSGALHVLSKCDTRQHS
jgi:hypothetical protein